MAQKITWSTATQLHYSAAEIQYTSVEARIELLLRYDLVHICIKTLQPSRYEERHDISKNTQKLLWLELSFDHSDHFSTKP